MVALAGFWASLKRIARGDVGPIVERMNRHIARAEAYVDSVDEGHVDELAPGPTRPRRDRRLAKDIAVITGLSLTMLGIKALKLLPNIPFAPGHKLVLLTPLYVVATLRTRTRLGATLTGLVMGSVAFLLGDGRYGIFEILKHVAPGIVCDLLVPLMLRLYGARTPGALAWSVVGGLMGLGRFATIFTVTLSVQAPAVAWAFLVPGLIIHTTFGVLSGLVSSPLIRALARDGHENVTPVVTSNPAEGMTKEET
jgi:hypothetical protein